MQGTELLKNPDFLKTLERSPFEARDLPGLSNAIADTFERLEPEQRQAMKEALDELDGLSEEQLLSFMRLLAYVEQNPDQYPKFINQLVQSGAFEEGDAPTEYDPRFLAVVKSMITEVLQKKQGEKPEGFARGGIVSLRKQAEKVQSAGRRGDTMLAHITPFEAGVLSRMGAGGSTNPKTGLPEFGFWKSVGKVLKIGAQIIGAAVLTPFVGPIAAGAIVGGVSSLLSGGSPADALKSALFGGITGGIGGGISSALGGGSFFEGAFSGGSLFGGGGGGGMFGNLFGGGTGAEGQAAGAAGVEPTVTDFAGARPYDAATQGAEAANAARAAAGFETAPTVTAKGGIENLFSLEGAKDIWSRYKLPIILGGGAALIGLSKATEDKAKPSLIQGPTGSQLLAQQPGRYGFDTANFVQQIPAPSPPVFPGGGYVAPSTATPQLAPIFDFTKITYPNPFITAAKAGGHIAGPGTGTSDSIPARLSDGEFVMTAAAVRGAGNGDRMKGARKMYELMHKFERMA